MLCNVQLGPLYLAVMDAVYAIPNATATLFFVEGGGQLGLPGLNWGDGFVTDTSLIRQYGLSDPNSFFRTLLTKPYLNNVGISPHVYPPSVTYATQVMFQHAVPIVSSSLCLPFWHLFLDVCQMLAAWLTGSSKIVRRICICNHTHPRQLLSVGVLVADYTRLWVVCRVMWAPPFSSECTIPLVIWILLDMEDISSLYLLAKLEASLLVVQIFSL